MKEIDGGEPILRNNKPEYRIRARPLRIEQADTFYHIINRGNWKGQEIKEIINTEIKNFVKDSLDTEISKALHNTNTKSRDELIRTIKNSMEAV